MKIPLTILLILGYSLLSNAQSDFITNPSFESTPGAGYAPSGWSSCNPNCTPDTQPGAWGLTFPASNLNTYAGLVMRDVSYVNAGYIFKNEDIQTTLKRPLLKGEKYKLSIDLAFNPNIDDGTGIPYNIPPYLRIIGGRSICDTSEVLKISPIISNTNWMTYEFEIMPVYGTYNILKLEIYSKPLKCSYLLLDNIKIVKILPDEAPAISGVIEVCSGEKNISYSVPEIYNTTNYKWDYSGTGAHINGSGNSINIDFDENATTGNLTVRGVNANGEGKVSTNFEIKITYLPSEPGEISGLHQLCSDKGTIGANYTIPAIGSATSYVWNYAGAGAVSHPKDTSLFIYYANGASNAIITVKGKNRCGFGPVSPAFLVNIIDCKELYDIYIPNAFTPNNDGVNDCFFIRGLVGNSKLIIFNRFGKEVYSSNNYQNDWNGKDNSNKILETDTYWYILSIPGIQPEYKGYVYLKK